MAKNLLSQRLVRISLFMVCLFYNHLTFAGQYTVSIEEDKILLNDVEVKIIGLRTSNALMSDDATDQLLANLDVFKSYGINTVSVYFMGSRFGDVQGYLPDSSLDPEYASRMSKIIEAADERGMIVLVGCLYWGNSKASAKLSHWTETNAAKAVANTVKWLSKNDYKNVFVDPDNEGMAWRKNKWRIETYVNAAHAVNPNIMVANNAKYHVPNADLNIHFGPKEASKPYVSTEATPHTELGGYWWKYSKEENYYNYIRIGVYSDSTKTRQLNDTKLALQEHNGYILASTWLQAGPAESIGGPFMKPGGYSRIENINKDVKKLHKDAGIKWWLEFIKSNHGPWSPPRPRQ